ncbi:Radical SAM superfamily enzyme [Candidatus Methanomarinus sp.]|nr:Radical SAM superfamily enzyme [ANME-2 cluster archaeon]
MEYYNFKTDVNTVLTKQNKDDVLNILYILLQRKIKRWKINRFYSIGQGALNRQKYEISNEDFSKVAKRLSDEKCIQNGEIEVFLKDNREAVMTSYINISPSGDILMFNKGNYRNIGDVFSIEDIREVLEVNGFSFDLHTKRHFRGQYTEERDVFCKMKLNISLSNNQKNKLICL